MRALLFLLLISLIGWSFTVVNLCNAPQDYVEKTDRYLQTAYDMYSKDMKPPSLCPDFYVELRDIEYGGLTYTKIVGGSACAYKIVIDCGMTDSQLLHIAFHEMAHALQASYYNGKPYDWYTEAHAEGITAYYLVERVWKVGAWQTYGWVKYFWSDRLYEKNPEKCTPPDLCAYKYGAFFAWLAWRSGPKNSSEVYASPSYQMMEVYRNFLLSPWSWGRDPSYYDYSECRDRSMAANSLLPCVYGPALNNYVYVFSSNTMINATLKNGVIYLALVAPSSTTADPSVTISNCDCPSQTTVTTTATTTQTVTVPTTTTVTTTVPITYTTTVTVPTTTTIPITVTTTSTVTITKTVPTTTTVTVTVPTTYTTTTTQTVTVPTTTTVTTTATATERVTETTTVTVPITVTRTEISTSTYTVTERVTEPGEGMSREVLFIVAFVALLVGCFICGYLRRDAR